MKNLLLLFLSFSAFTLFSQSITVEPHEKNVNINNSTSIAGDLGTDIKVKNISNNTISIKVSRQVISATAGSENYFCWQTCFLPPTSVSPDAITFAPQHVSINDFQVHFENNDIVPASASIKYCAFDANNESDSACTIVNFSVSITDISVEDDFNNIFFSEFHPNPTSSTAFLDYNLMPNDVAEVIVSNILGKIIHQQKIENQNGTLKFDVSNTKSGLYFANIIVNNELKTVKRLVVN